MTQHLGGFPIFDNQCVSIKLWFCRRPPNTLFVNSDRSRPKGCLRMAMERLMSPLAFTKKPDTDNCVKFVLDGLKGVAWRDDQQVVKIVAYKCYDSVPPYEGRTLVEVSVGHNDVEHFPSWALVHATTGVI